jgi:hypothetical protein
MKTISPSEKLTLLILEKEAQQCYEQGELKAELKAIYENLKPINLIKNSISEAIRSPEIKDNLLNAAIGLATGFIAKKLINFRSNGLFKAIEANILQFIVAAKVTDNASDIRSFISSIFQNASTKQTSPETHSE